MSLAVDSGSLLDILTGFLGGYDVRMKPGQAHMLVLQHNCKWCRTSLKDLPSESQRLVFLVDSNRAIHDLCPTCAERLKGADVGASEIDVATLEDPAQRKAIFGIMVGELRHTQFKGERRTSSVPSVQSQAEVQSGGREPKPCFVRHHPARRGMPVMGIR